MDLDVGPLYAKITKADGDGHHLYGLIPFMAASSFGQIGAPR